MDKRLPTIERMPEIETPVIDIQDLEHHPDSGTRVHDAGIEVLPQLDLGREDKEMRAAIDALEEAIKDLPPG